jgi:predicted phage terminase large subunit-like protein
MEKQRRECGLSFYAFFVASFNILDPEVTYVDNWHVRVFCSELQAAVWKVMKGEQKQFDIIINTPPKSLKSRIVSVALPAWIWIHSPHLKLITASYSPDLADRDCADSRKLITSDWYQYYWGRRYHLMNNAATFLVNDRGGERRTTSPRSSATGHKADIILADDPNAADDRYSQADRELVIRWWTETMSSRLDTPLVGLKIIIQQRIDDYDLTGYLLKEQPALYARLSLPADLSEGDKPFPEILTKFYQNKLMFSKRLGREVLDAQKLQLRTAYSGQYNQRPIVSGGRYFKEAWFKWFVQAQLPHLQQVIVSVDASNSDAKDSCPASIQVWGYARPNAFMLYDYTERLSAIKTSNEIERIAKMYPGCILVIEKAANGFFIIEHLKQRYAVYEFLPAKFGGKEVRAEMVAPLWETGNIFIADNPHNRTVYMDEITSFPNSPFKDRVDAMSQALLYFTRCSAGSPTPVTRFPGQV